MAMGISAVPDGTRSVLVGSTQDCVRLLSARPFGTHADFFRSLF